MDESSSYLLRFERRDGEPDEKVYFEDLTEAKEHFNAVNCPDDSELRRKYSCIVLVEVDWYKRANYEIDAVDFGDYKNEE